MPGAQGVCWNLYSCLLEKHVLVRNTNEQSFFFVLLLLCDLPNLGWSNARAQGVCWKFFCLCLFKILIYLSIFCKEQFFFFFLLLLCGCAKFRLIKCQSPGSLLKILLPMAFLNSRLLANFLQRTVLLLLLLVLLLFRSIKCHRPRSLMKIYLPMPFFWW